MPTIHHHIVSTLVLLIGICAAVLIAPGEAAAGKAADARIAMLTRHLELTDEQAISVTDILKGADQLAEIDNSRYAGDAAAMASAEKTRREMVEKQLAEVLTEDQMTRYLELRDAQPQGTPPGDGPLTERMAEQLETLKSRLSLDEDQEAQLHDVLSRYGAQLDTARPDPDSRPSRDEMRGNMEAMRSIQNKMDQEIAAILTPEQMEKYRAYRQETRRQRGPGREGGRGGRQR
ncbi:MAG: hypothetical protein KKA42_06770 [candidate division Zixibacteria bacterium]|nr:hypothetical protein [candidate division Zixibacteria bacterium]